MKRRLFPHGIVARRRHRPCYDSSSRLALRKNPSVSFVSLFLCRDTSDWYNNRLTAIWIKTVRNRERALEPCIRNIVVDDFIDALEDFEVVTNLVAGPEGDNGFKWRAAGQGAGQFRNKDNFVREKGKAQARPGLDAVECGDLFGAFSEGP